MDREVTVYFHNYKAQSLQYMTMAAAFFWILSGLLIFSAVSRFICIFLLIFIVTLVIMMISENRKKDKNYLMTTKSVNIEAHRKRLKLIWVCWGVLMSAVSVINIVLHIDSDYTSLYGILTVLSDFISPFLTAVIPVSYICMIKACEGCSSDEYKYTNDNRKTRNYVIVMLITIGFVCSYSMMFYAAPKISRTAPAYFEGLNNPTTHDLSTITKFKSSEMENTDLQELFKNLPMKGELKSVTTDYADKSVTIKYGNSGSDKLFIKKAVIYNSTAAYALADNLKNIYFEIGEDRFYVKRSSVISLYDNFKNILSSTVWEVDVKINLKDDKYSENAFDIIADKE